MKLILVQPDPEIRATVVEFLARLGHQTVALRRASALSELPEEVAEAEVLLVDAGPNDARTVAVLDEIRVCHPHLAIVVALGHESCCASGGQSAVCASFPCISSPLSLVEIEATLERLQSDVGSSAA